MHYVIDLLGVAVFAISGVVAIAYGLTLPTVDVPPEDHHAV